MKYRKLPGHRRGLFHSASLWLGADHLLSVKGARVREEYKRFHFRDIQAIVIADAPRFHVSTRSMGIGAVWLAAYIAVVNRTSLAHAIFWPIFAGLVISWLYISGACSCRCRIFTAVSRDDLPSIYRTWTARRFLEQLEPHILAAQGGMPENWAQAVGERVLGPEEFAIATRPITQAVGGEAAVVGGPAAVEAPRPPGRDRTLVSDVFVASLFADAIVIALTLQTGGLGIQWAIYGLALAKMVTAIAVLVQCYRRVLAPAMQRLAIASLLVLGCLYYLRPLFISAQAQANPGRFVKQDSAALYSIPGVFRKADAISSGILGVIGGFLTVRAAGRQPETI